MLDPWIIEEIRREEEESARRELEQPVLEVYEMPPCVEEAKPEEPEPRGVIVIDFNA